MNRLSRLFTAKVFSESDYGFGSGFPLFVSNGASFYKKHIYLSVFYNGPAQTQQDTRERMVR